jgi:hypothetical protein
MNPISLVHLHKLLLPSPRSHWSATGPRSKTQPTTTQHTKRIHTRHNCWNLKPVRPVSETGQTASVGLSLTQTGETGQTNFVQKLPKTPLRPNTPEEPFHIWTKEAIAQQILHCSKTLSATDTPLLKNPSRQPTGRNRSGRFWPGQSRRTQR